MNSEVENLPNNIAELKAIIDQQQGKISSLQIAHHQEVHSLQAQYQQEIAAIQEQLYLLTLVG